MLDGSYPSVAAQEPPGGPGGPKDEQRGPSRRVESFADTSRYLKGSRGIGLSNTQVATGHRYDQGGMLAATWEPASHIHRPFSEPAHPSLGLLRGRIEADEAGLAGDEILSLVDEAVEQRVKRSNPMKVGALDRGDVFGAQRGLGSGGNECVHTERGPCSRGTLPPFELARCRKQRVRPALEHVASIEAQALEGHDSRSRPVRRLGYQGI